MFNSKPPAVSDLKIAGKRLVLRSVEETDAAFILSLRLDERYSQWLSPVENDLMKQKQWIRKYKERERQGCEYYFIIECRDIACGTVRVYALESDSFCWGSWILNQDKAFGASLESFFMILFFGFNNLSREVCRWEIMKGNLRMISFFNKMGIKPFAEDENQYLYRFLKSDYLELRTRYENLIE